MGREGVLCLMVVLSVAAKLTWPEASYSAREKLCRLLCRDSEYQEVLTAMGRAVSRGTVKEELVEVLARGFSNDGMENGFVSAAETDAVVPLETLSTTKVDTPEMQKNNQTEDEQTVLENSPVPEQADAAGLTPDAVSAFIEKEAAFEGYDIPGNVRTDMPELPFEYAKPVGAQDSSGFGFRVHPIKNKVCFHYGTDFAAESGAAVWAFADGYVYAAGTSESYGNYYILTHEGGCATLYAHLSEFVAMEGDMVKKGQLIGRVGQSGNTTGPHLHFELLMDDVYLNPEYYI